jgi:hypothetical protein
MNFFEWLDHIDKILFTLIQHDTDHAVLDVAAPILRDPYTWIPFYAFMLYYSLRYAGMVFHIAELIDLCNYR